MTQTKFYVQVLVEKELPAEEGRFLTESTWRTYNGSGHWVRIGQFRKRNPEWWLKEISITDLMTEFAKYNEVDDTDDEYNERVVKEFLQSKGYSI